MNTRVKILVFALLSFSCRQHKTIPIVKKEQPCNHTQWLPVEKGVDVDPLVEGMVVYNEELIVAGRFKMAGNVRVRNIAKWNGKKWDSLGGGISDNTLALGLYNNELYVTGWWNKAGNIVVSNIAKWNGKNWSNVGEGLDMYAQIFAEYKGDLYAGGAFTWAGKIMSPAIARWDSKNWLNAGGKMFGAYEIADWGPNAGKRVYVQPIVKSLCVYKGELYVSGFFTKIGKDKICDLAKWDGEKWTGIDENKLSTFTNVQINAFAIYNGCLFMAGHTYVGDDYGYTSYITFWDGKKLTRMNLAISDSNVDSEIKSMVVFDNALYVAGKFKSIGGINACNLAKWDGTKWSGVGYDMQSKWSGDNGDIETTALYNGTLYAGGLFEKAGGYIVNNIARLVCADSIKADNKTVVSLTK